MDDRLPVPSLTASETLAFQFSSWYDKFAHLTVKSTVIRPLPSLFRDYLESDGVFLPGNDSSDSISDEGDEGNTDDTIFRKRFSFPELESQIQKCIDEYGSVFPKLNFSSPKDASWILPAGSPMRCTSPADVFILLKSSDFIAHDLDSRNVFPSSDGMESDRYDIELVLRKWYSFERSRELRCFIRENRLIGISQRDKNYYEFLNDHETKELILKVACNFWAETIKPLWSATSDYVLDLYLTRDLSRAHIVDFNPYATHTDALLFTYEELGLKTDSEKPELRVVDSRSHVAANVNAFEHQHNMLPLEAFTIGLEGLSVGE